jgi:glycosyltransferase involved in cell wall biosynthesis
MVPIPVIIIPVLNRYDLLRRAVWSIDYPVETLILIDNGDRRETYPWHTKPTTVYEQYVWHIPTNLGVGPSWNAGIKSTPHRDGWLLLNSDAWFPSGELERFWQDCQPDNIVKTRSHWSCVWIGSQVVANIGLFSECYVPAYFEDNDFEQRAVNAGFSLVVSEAQIGHDNSSTIGSDPFLLMKNAHSFEQNRLLHVRRWSAGVPEAGAWDLTRRRELGWE